MSLIIRQAMLEDEIVIIDIVRQYWRDNKNEFGISEQFFGRYSNEDQLEKFREYYTDTKFEAQRKNDRTFIACDNKQKMIGFIQGGLSLDNEDYDCEIYSLFILVDDKLDKIRQSLFDELIIEFKKQGFKNVHVEIRTNDVNRDFYFRQQAKFVTSINNMTDPPFQTEDYGWNDIEAIKYVQLN